MTARQRRTITCRDCGKQAPNQGFGRCGTCAQRARRADPSRPRCTFPDCGRWVSARGLCAAHYSQQSRGQELRPVGEAMELRRQQPTRLCDVDGCGRKHVARGYCSTHWEQWRRGADPTVIPPVRVCEFPGCGRRHSARGLCEAHYRQSHRGQELHPIGKPRTPKAVAKPPKAARPKAAPKVDPLPPATPMPPGWYTRKAKPEHVPTKPCGEAVLHDVGTIPELPTATRRDALAVLAMHGALDLAEMLGLDDLLDGRAVA